MERQNEVFGVVSLNPRLVCSAVNNIQIYKTRCATKCAIYRKYSTVGTCDVKRHSAISTYIVARLVTVLSN